MVEFILWVIIIKQGQSFIGRCYVRIRKSIFQITKFLCSSVHQRLLFLPLFTNIFHGVIQIEEQAFIWSFEEFGHPGRVIPTHSSET